MNQVTSTRLIFGNSDEPFPCYAPWPLPDACLEVVDIGYWLATVPRGKAPKGEDNGVVIFMQEAWRCLIPGGALTISVPLSSHPFALANPLFRHYFNEQTFTAFGRPAEADEQEWRWDRYGVDFGTRFVILHVAETGRDLEITMEKPHDEEYVANVECFGSWDQEHAPEVEGSEAE